MRIIIIIVINQSIHWGDTCKGDEQELWDLNQSFIINFNGTWGDRQHSPLVHYLLFAMLHRRGQIQIEQNRILLHLLAVRKKKLAQPLKERHRVSGSSKKLLSGRYKKTSVTIIGVVQCVLEKKIVRFIKWTFSRSPCPLVCYTGHTQYTT